MKVLHSSDWHLGHRIVSFPRDEEFSHFFVQLQKILIEYKVDLLVIAGDVFHSANPSHSAQEQWFKFLGWLVNNGIKALVIPGNHDSAQLLGSPSLLTEELGIHIVSDSPKILEFEDLYCAAMPFQRESDLLESHVPFQNGMERQRALAQAQIEKMQALFEEIPASSKPSLFAGHLFAAGCSPSDSERDIFAGGLGAVDTSQFPAFDYCALGHIHSRKILREVPLVAYSGNVLQMDFAETEQKYCLLWDSIKPASYETIEIDAAMTFVSLEGSYEEIYTAISRIESPCWIEVNLNGVLTDSITQLEMLAEDRGMKIVRLKRVKKEGQAQELEAARVRQLDPQEAFERLLLEYELHEPERTEVLGKYSSIVKEVQSLENS
jgi:exonuclease SbcD